MALDLDRIIDKWVDNLQNDSDLSTGLPETVAVYKGVRRIENIHNRFSIFVFRDRMGEQRLHLGNQQYDIEIIVNLVAVTRNPMDPEKIEEYSNTFISNILNHVHNHKSEPGYWAYAIYAGGDAVTMRDATQQDIEFEILPIRCGILNVT